VLELAGVTAGYGQHVVVGDVDLVVPDGAVVALLGPNGAGKSTLLRVAAGHLRPNAGRVILDGHDATGWSPHRLAGAGLCHVPEGRGIFPTLTVRDNIRLQARPGVDRTAIDQVAQMFPRLGERLSQRAGTLSGGEQQMLAIARAYAAQSTVVLLDEVSLGLAPKVVDQIYGALHRLAAQGSSLLLVEQYVSKALDLADYVYILNKGRVEFVGEASELGDDQILASYLGA
jgi:branched-chain amino acid transport system ATP-binding protein